MDKYLITISREFGCGAREIARGLASRLVIPLYDKDLVEATVKKAGLDSALLTDLYDEDSISLDKKSLWSSFGYGSSDAFLSEKAIQAQIEVIREIAERKESCIIFGRCADYVLQEYDNCLSFFLYMPIEKRIEHMRTTYGLTEKEAAKMVKRIDKQRHNYYKYVTNHNRGDRNGKDVLINVDTFGVEGSIEMMLQSLRIFQGHN